MASKLSEIKAVKHERLDALMSRTSWVMCWRDCASLTT